MVNVQAKSPRLTLCRRRKFLSSPRPALYSRCDSIHWRSSTAKGPAGEPAFPSYQLYISFSFSFLKEKGTVHFFSFLLQSLSSNISGPSRFPTLDLGRTAISRSRRRRRRPQCQSLGRLGRACSSEENLSDWGVGWHRGSRYLLLNADNPRVDTICLSGNNNRFLGRCVPSFLLIL